MTTRLPPWLKKKAPAPGVLRDMKALFDELGLHTVCDSAMCPNQGDCLSQGTATFLLLGNICTRRCTFCSIDKGAPAPPDRAEPQHLAEAVRRLGLRHIVLTSVTREDLRDGGASHWAETVSLLRARDRALTIEGLIPDFNGSLESLRTVVAAGPDVINHNVETVPRLYSEIRPGAVFQRSLRLLEEAKKLYPAVVTKSGIMLGLGETENEVVETFEELRRVGCDVLTVSQYLQPSPRHHRVVRFITPEEFEGYGRLAAEIGFRSVASAPFVRSSYQAATLCAQARYHIVAESLRPKQGLVADIETSELHVSPSNT